MGTTPTTSDSKVNLTPKEYGGIIETAVPGARLSTQDTRPSGMVRTSALPGSIGSEEARALQTQAIQNRQQGDYEKAAMLQNQADYLLMSEQQKTRARILATPTSSGYRTVGGRTQQLVSAEPRPYIALSPGFAGKASTIAEVDVRTIQAPSRMTASLKTPYVYQPPSKQTPFFYSKGKETVTETPTEIVKTQEWLPTTWAKEYGGTIKSVPPLAQEYGGDIISKKPSLYEKWVIGTKESMTQFKAWGKLAWATAKGVPKLIAYSGTAQTVLSGSKETTALLETPESRAALFTGATVVAELLPTGLTQAVAQGIFLPKAIREAQLGAYGREAVELSNEAGQRAVEKLNQQEWTIKNAPQKVLSWITPIATGMKNVQSEVRNIAKEKGYTPEQTTQAVKTTREILGTSTGGEFATIVNVERNIERAGQKWIAKGWEKLGGKVLTKAEALNKILKSSRLKFKVLGATEGVLQYFGVQEIRGQPKTAEGFLVSGALGGLFAPFFGIPVLQKRIRLVRGTAYEVGGQVADFPQEMIGDITAGQSKVRAVITKVDDKFMLGTAREGGERIRVSVPVITGGIASTITKTPSSFITKAKTPSSIVTKTKAPSSIVTKTKTPSSIVTEMKSPSSIVTETKTPSSIITKTRTPVTEITKIPVNVRTKVPVTTTTTISTITTKFPWLKVPSRTSGDRGYGFGAGAGYKFTREYKIKTPKQFFEILVGNKGKKVKSWY